MTKKVCAASVLDRGVNRGGPGVEPPWDTTSSRPVQPAAGVFSESRANAGGLSGRGGRVFWAALRDSRGVLRSIDAVLADVRRHATILGATAREIEGSRLVNRAPSGSASPTH